MSVTLQTFENPTFHITTSLVPYVLFMTVFGWLFSKWYVPLDNGPGLMEMLGASFLIFFFSLLLSGIVYGSGIFLYAMADKTRTLGFDPSLSQFAEHLGAGVYSGLVFIWITGAIQIPIALIGSWYFCRNYPKNSNAL